MQFNEYALAFTDGPDLAGYVTSGETDIWFGDVSQMQSCDKSEK